MSGISQNGASLVAGINVLQFTDSSSSGGSGGSMVRASVSVSQIASQIAASNQPV